VVPEAGLEPARVSPYAPQAYVSAISPPGHFRQDYKLSEEAYYTYRLLIVKPAAPGCALKKTLFSLLVLVLFVLGVGKDPLLPSLRILAETSWDPSLFPRLWSEKSLAIIAFSLTILGFFGWAGWLRELFLKGLEGPSASFVGLSISIVLFSLYVWGLAVNGILVGPLTALFFLPALPRGWRALENLWLQRGSTSSWAVVTLCFPGMLWAAEYLSPPIIWDAVLDHFRYAKEVARLHQVPLQWVNHTGDMPKASGMLLAGFWSMGGEALSKLSGLLALAPALGVFGLALRQVKASAWIGGMMFLTCPLFLALCSWGYAEGILASFELLSLYCFWKALENPAAPAWVRSSAFFMGASLAVKYTAVLAIVPILFLAFYERVFRGRRLALDGSCLFFFLLPAFPWLFKNVMAYGNPFYPLGTVIFGSAVGYGPGMEKGLWADTGTPVGFDPVAVFSNLWSVLFTASNGVGAAWTPLAIMGLPWIWRAGKGRPEKVLFSFLLLFMLGWAFFCTGLRHAAGGSITLALLGTLGWAEALKGRALWPRALFAAGTLVAFWLCLSAQVNSTAPYASALGLEDPERRLKRHYSYDPRITGAYRFIEERSGPKDKVVAFAVFQAYPLERTTFVDFKWKTPIFLEWASQCDQAGQLASRLRREGVEWFLYQRWEAKAMSKVGTGFHLGRMSVDEYARFWRTYMEPVGAGGNIRVFRLRRGPVSTPMGTEEMPYLREIGRN
jgi:hypothetical protein